MATIRNAEAADEALVLALLSRLMDLAAGTEVQGEPEEWRVGFRRVLAEPARGVALVAEDESGLVGFITVSFNLAMRFGGSYAQIEELIVDERVRGQRLGARLVESAIRAGRDAGCREIGLYALERNRGFYEKLGFAYAGPELRRSL